MAIKSALMTTGYDVLDGPDTRPADPIFRQGAGHVRPNNAADPGLVFDSGFDDWLGFLCGTQLLDRVLHWRRHPGLDPSDLNVASIAIGDLAGIADRHATVTNVGNGPATYTPCVTGMAGVDVGVSPRR